MIDERTILTAERLRDELIEFKAALRKRYQAATQVSSDALRRQAAALAQKWLVELGTDERQDQLVRLISANLPKTAKTCGNWPR